MFGKNKRVYATAALTLILLVLMSPVCFANSSEPPSIIIIVPNAPEDLDVSLNTPNGVLEGYMEKKFMETQFSFYSFGYKTDTEYSVNLIYNGESESLALDEAAETYMNVYELDYKGLTIVRGTAGYRVWLYTAVRILLTLAIEAVIFFLFRYKNRRSWIVFILVNLITQGALNLWLNTFSNPNAYLIFVLVIGEAFVFLVEVIGFLVLIKEHKKLRTLLYVMIANLASLFLGGYLITLMPM